MGEWVITSSVLILLILGIRYCFRNKIAQQVRYGLWLVVAVRLLIPLPFSESSFSVLNYLRWEPAGAGQDVVTDGGVFSADKGTGDAYGTGTVHEMDGLRQAGQYSGGAGSLYSESSAGQGGASAGRDSVQTEKDSADWGSDQRGRGMNAGNAGKGQGIPDSLRFLFLTIWLLGAAALAGIVAFANCSYRRKVYASRLRYRTEGKTVLPVYISPAVVTPCMFGIRNPAVYLTPGIEKNGKAIRYVLCHEYTHYRHRDNFWALVRVICVCLHWYNPLVWVAAALSRQDCELACDERTLRLLREEERIDYGRTLLDFSVQQDILHGGLQLSTAVAGGKKQLKERLMMIVGHPRRTAGSLAMTMSLVLLVSAATFTGRVSGQELSGTEGSSGSETDESGRDISGNGAGGTAEEIFGGSAGGIVGLLYGNREGGVAAGVFGSAEEGVEGTLGSDAGEPVEDISGSGTGEPVRHTSIVAVNLNDGMHYTLKAGGENAESSGEYRVEQLEFNRIYDKKEQTLQTIPLEDVKVLYTMPLAEVQENGGQMWSFSSGREALYAKPLYTADRLPAYAVSAFQDTENGADLSELFAGGIYAADLNFDGCQDFYLQGRSSGAAIPYYCYLWNPDAEAFEPAYMIPNLRVNEKLQLLESPVAEEDVYSVKYYRFDDENVLHMVRYTEENHSPDAIFPTLDLTYCETSYTLPAVDEWDYGTRYGGALTERYVRMAKNALEELYEWSGTKVDTACFMVTSFGDVYFGNTPQDMNASRIYYSRCYGEEEDFDDCIRNMALSTERVVWYSPVTQWKVPERLERMTEEELVSWYFERSPVAEGEEAEAISEDYENEYTVRTASGRYYVLYIQPLTRELGSIYGPYDGVPMH